MQSQFIKDLITLPGFLIHGERKEGERWIFKLSLPPHCPICPTCFGRTTKISSKRKQWIHGYTNTVGLFWIELPIERRRCQACFLTFTVSYGIVSTLGRPVMHRKNDSRSRSLVTTRLYDSRTLVLSICPGSFTNIESYSSMCG